MFENTFNSIMNNYHYLNMMNLDKVALDNIDFTEFKDNKQFKKVLCDDNHIIFFDAIRKKHFEMKKLEPYCCGKSYYTIKEIKIDE